MSYEVRFTGLGTISKDGTPKLKEEDRNQFLDWCSRHKGDNYAMFATTLGTPESFSVLQYYIFEVLPRSAKVLIELYPELEDADSVHMFFMEYYGKRKLKINGVQVTIQEPFELMSKQRKIKFIADVVVYMSTNYKISFPEINQK